MIELKRYSLGRSINNEAIQSIGGIILVGETDEAISSHEMTESLNCRYFLIEENPLGEWKEISEFQKLNIGPLDLDLPPYFFQISIEGHG